jgi:hypothetical protein
MITLLYILKTIQGDIMRDRVYGTGGVLISWVQRRCDRCHCFLSKEERKYCKRCFPKVHSTQPDKRDYKSRCLKDPYHKIRMYLYCKVHRSADKFNVGDYI